MERRLPLALPVHPPYAAVCSPHPQAMLQLMPAGVQRKRKNGAQCSGCGSVVAKAGELCVACIRRKERDAKREAALDARATISVRRLNGRIEQFVTVRHFHIDDRRVLTLSGFGNHFGERLSMEAPVGKLLTGILAFLHAKPDVVHRADVARHATMVREFMDYVVDRSIAGQATHVPVPEMPIRLLEWALHDWVESYWRPARGGNPLLLSFAINTAELVAAIAFGSSLWSSSRGRADVLPVVDVEEHEKSIRFLNDSGFKRQVSMDSVAGMIVIARLPTEVVVRELADFPILSESLERDSVLGAKLVRCHLSQGSPTDPRTDFAFEDSTAPTFDITNGFEFRAELLVVEGNGTRRPWRPGEAWTTFRADGRSIYFPIIALPARWITHALDAEYVNGMGVRYEHIPVPNWDPSDSGEGSV